MKITHYILFIFLPIILCSSRCDNKKKLQSLFNDDCPLSYKIEWTIVEDGTSVDKQIELLSKIALAAKADAENLNRILGEVSGEAEFGNTFELSKVIKSETIRKAQVSQDVYDEYIRTRTASCNIWDAIQNKLYGEDIEALKKARDLFTEIQMKFGQLEVKKKNLN